MTSTDFKMVISTVIVIVALFGGVTLKAVLDEDFYTLERNGEVIVKEKWVVEAERTYFKLDSWYDSNIKCPKIEALGGYRTASQCRYPSDFYEQMSRSIINTKIYNVSTSVFKEVPFYAYGTRGSYAGILTENFFYNPNASRIEDFPQDYRVEWFPKDTRNYKMVWRVESLKKSELTDGNYTLCTYTFGYVKIDLKGECENLERTEIFNNGKKAYFFFEPQRGIQIKNVALFDPDTIPKIEFINNTPANNSFISDDYVFVNVSATDDNDFSAFLDWNRSLVGWWNFESYNSTHVFDNSSYGHDATFENGMTTDNISSGGIRGNTALMNEDNGEYLQVDISKGRSNVSDAVTISAWVNQTKQLGISSFATVDDKFALATLLGVVAFAVTDETGNFKSSYVLNAPYINKWTHFVGRWSKDASGGSLDLFINGVEASYLLQESLTTSLNDSSTLLKIGSVIYDGSTNYYEGAIDEVMLWDRNLSDAEIAALYNAGSNRLEANFTELSDADYTYSAYAIDSLGQVNRTEERLVNVDAVSPFYVYDCDTLDEVGATYYLANDIIDSTTDNCLDITANNVTLDCQGHLVDSNDDDSHTAGIRVSRNAPGELTNVTIRNCDVTDWGGSNSGGIYLSYAHGVNISQVNASSNTNGIYYSHSDYTTFYNVTARENTQDGVFSDLSAFDVLTNCTLAENAEADFNFDYLTSVDLSYQCFKTFNNVTNDNGLFHRWYNGTVNVANESVAYFSLCNASHSNVTNITVIGSELIRNGAFGVVWSDYVSVSDINSSGSEVGLQIVNSDYGQYNNIIANKADNFGIGFVYNQYNNFSNVVCDYSDSYNIIFLASSYNNITNFSVSHSLDSGMGMPYGAGENYNIFNDGTIINNTNYGVYHYGVGNVYANIFFNNSIDNFRWNSGDSFYNLTNISGTRIHGNGNRIGGNYWATPDGDGFSETCADADYDGFCDVAYDVENEAVGCTSDNCDYLPLSDDYDSFTITLNTPANNSYLSDNTPNFNFTADSLHHTNFTCLLLLDGFNVKNNTNVTDSVSANITNETALSDGKHYYYIRCGQNHSETRNFTIDTTLPKISYGLNTYANDTFRNDNFVFVNVSINESNVANVSFFLFNSSWNLVNSSNVTAHFYNFSVSDSNERYYYNVTVEDLVNRKNTTGVRTLTLDTTFPTVDYYGDVEDNNTYWDRDWIIINISAFDTNDANVTFFLFNETALRNLTNTTFSDVRHNYLSLPNGNYTFNVTARDKAGNKNTTPFRFHVLDTTQPKISYGLQTEEDGSYADQNWVFVNVSVNESNVANVTFFLFNSTMNLVNSSNGTAYYYNFSVTDSNELYYFNATTHDMVGRKNTTSVRNVILDTTQPKMNFSAGTEGNNSVIGRGWVFVNVTINETNFKNVSIDLWNLTGSGKTLLNRTNFSYSASNHYSVNFTQHTGGGELNSGAYYFNATVFDKVKRSNSTLTWNLSIHRSFPTITLDSPANNSLFDANWTFVNFTWSETHNDSFWIEFNSVNYTPTCTDVLCTYNFTNLSSGLQFFRAGMNNTFGRTSFTGMRQVLLDTTPLVNFTISYCYNVSDYMFRPNVTANYNYTIGNLTEYGVLPDNVSTRGCLFNASNNNSVSLFLYAQSNLTDSGYSVACNGTYLSNESFVLISNVSSFSEFLFNCTLDYINATKAAFFNFTFRSV